MEMKWVIGGVSFDVERTMQKDIGDYLESIQGCERGFNLPKFNSRLRTP